MNLRSSLTVLTLVSACLQPAGAGETQALDGGETPAPKSHGRQLATLSPTAVAPTAALLKKPAPASSASGKRSAAKTRSAPSGQSKSGRKSAAGKAASEPTETPEPWGIVLKGLDEDVIDAVEVFSKRAGKLASAKFKDVAHAFGDFYRQLNGPPTFTPMGGPYLQTSASRKQVWTQEGRIKTVVER